MSFSYKSPVISLYYTMHCVVMKWCKQILLEPREQAGVGNIYQSCLLPGDRAACLIVIIGTKNDYYY